MEKKNILDKINHDDGMRVPEGYFKQFAADMATSASRATLGGGTG